MDKYTNDFMEEYLMLKIELESVSKILEREVGFMKEYTCNSVIEDKNIESWKKRIILGRIRSFILNIHRLIDNI